MAAQAVRIEQLGNGPTRSGLTRHWGRRHWDLAGRLVVGALVVLVVAVLGPAFISWFQAVVGADGGRLLGGRP